MPIGVPAPILQWGGLGFGGGGVALPLPLAWGLAFALALLGLGGGGLFVATLEVAGFLLGGLGGAGAS